MRNTRYYQTFGRLEKYHVYVSWSFRLKIAEKLFLAPNKPLVEKYDQFKPPSYLHLIQYLMNLLLF